MFVQRIQEARQILVRSLTTVRCSMIRSNSPGEWIMTIPKSDSSSVDAQHLLLGIYCYINATAVAKCSLSPKHSYSFFNVAQNRVGYWKYIQTGNRPVDEATVIIIACRDHPIVVFFNYSLHTYVDSYNYSVHNSLIYAQYNSFPINAAHHSTLDLVSVGAILLLPCSKLMLP